MAERTETIETIKSSSTTRILRSLDENLEVALGTAFLLMYSGLIAFIILMRLVGGWRPMWGQEVVKSMFVWMSWLAVAYAIRKRNHIRFSLFLDRAPMWIVYSIYWIEWIVWLAFAGVIFRYSFTVVGNYMSSGKVLNGTQVPYYLLYLSISVGFGLVLLRVVQQIYLTTRDFRNGEDIRPSGGVGE